MGFEPPMTGQRVLGRHKAAPIRALLGALLCAMFPLITQAETLRYKNIDHGLLSQKIDHQGRVAGTFQQRYTIVRDYSHDASQAPVLNFICNTTACDEKSLPWGVALLAREIGATMVLLETRFLGQSQPFGDLSVEKLGLLTTDQVVDDLADFQKFVRVNLGLRGAWLNYGSSWSGRVATFFAAKYPRLSDGTIASSAPLRPDRGLGLGYTTKAFGVLPAACLSKIEMAIAAVDSTTADLPVRNGSPQTSLRDSQRFLAVALLNATLRGFGNEVCEQAAAADDESQLLDYLTMGMVPKIFGPGAGQVDVHGVSDVKLSSSTVESGARQAAWLKCTEYRNSIRLEPGPGIPLLRDLLGTSIEDGLSECKELFGITTYPDSEKVFSKFLAPILSGQESRILFVNPFDDPWYVDTFNEDFVKRHPAMKAKSYDFRRDPGEKFLAFHGRDTLGLKYPADVRVRKVILDSVRTWLAQARTQGLVP